MNLGQAVRSGATWTFIGQYTSTGLSLVAGIVLARHLEITDFGIVATARIAWEMIRMLGAAGINAKLIQQPTEVERYATASFWLNLCVATTVMLLAFATAPFAAHFFKSPQAAPIIQILGISFLLSSLGNIHSALLTKELEFRKLNLVEIASSLATSSASVLMALNGWGVWSLVLPELLASPLRVLGFWLAKPWRPRLQLELALWKDIFHYGKFFVGMTVLRYLNINGDYVIIGRTLGTAALGVYSFAYNLANWPMQNIVWTLTRVTFPAFSKLQNDFPTMREFFLTIVNVISLVVFPCFLGLICVADLLIPFIYGEKWHVAVLPLQIIVGFMLIRSIVSPSGQILKALGKPNKEFYFNAAQLLPVLGSIYLGSHFGIVGVAIAMATSVGSFALVFLWITTSEIELPLWKVALRVMPAAVCALLMCAGVLGLRQWLGTQALHPVLELLSSAAVGCVLYLVLLRVFFPQEASKLWYWIHSTFSKRPRPANGASE